ncbi:hypothetical protein [Natrinema altunense]|uniref:Uncharacterized protein n=1 Tax=Natrinema altunense (strain JCM 12890 / CGMCC 1.3731 / AJ2) TaxID=1227494 RepID=L9ZFV4_NATA2|nr:hypothetical protein [Natrinema altunense]ELY84487.1 hypothetical protein C485_14055 [Natrinema altunense JCM 12890]
MLQLALLPLQAGGEAANVDSTAVLVGMIIGLIIGGLIAAGAGYWVYKDASKRENNELLWGIGVAATLFLVFPIGILVLVAYVIVRGDETGTEPMQEGGAAGGDW